MYHNLSVSQDTLATSQLHDANFSPTATSRSVTATTNSDRGVLTASASSQTAVTASNSITRRDSYAQPRNTALKVPFEVELMKILLSSERSSSLSDDIEQLTLNEIDHTRSSSQASSHHVSTSTIKETLQDINFGSITEEATKALGIEPYTSEPWDFELYKFMGLGMSQRDVSGSGSLRAGDIAQSPVNQRKRSGVSSQSAVEH